MALASPSRKVAESTERALRKQIDVLHDELETLRKVGHAVCMLGGGAGFRTTGLTLCGY